MKKPSIEQTAWVLGHLAAQLREGGSFRYLIYDRMGYGHEAYAPLYGAGGMTITNVFLELSELQAEAEKKRRRP